MKKNFAFILLALIITPLLALFGCGDVSSYRVEAYSSSTIHGTVSGRGTFEEGQEVTLVATAKTTNSKQSHVICWLYEDSTIVSEKDGYKIENILDDEKKPIKSTLTFKVNKETKGNYTAVFEEEKMMYSKLSGFVLAKQESLPDNLETFEQLFTSFNNPELAAEICTSNITISQHQDAMTPVTAFSTTDFVVKDYVLNQTNDVVEVLKITPDTTQNLTINLQMTTPDGTPQEGEEQQYKTSSNTFKISFGYKPNIPDSLEDLFLGTNPESIYISYSAYIENKYSLCVAFNHAGVDYMLMLIYEDLALPTPPTES